MFPFDALLFSERSFKYSCTTREVQAWSYYAARHLHSSRIVSRFIVPSFQTGLTTNVLCRKRFVPPSKSVRSLCCSVKFDLAAADLFPLAHRVSESQVQPPELTPQPSILPRHRMRRRPRVLSDRCSHTSFRRSNARRSRHYSTRGVHASFPRL